MAVYVVTGKLGSGKTLVAVGKIKDKLHQGAKVATNLDLKMHHLPGVGRKAKSPRVMRIPDKPSIEDLEAIGRGTDSYDEGKNGLLVLDECGTWFNSRSWADKERQKVINWFLHARKLGWDIIFLIQDLSIMDKQARVALAEHVVYCRRIDKVTIPFVGSLYAIMTGSKLPLPKIHMGIVKYGDSPQSMTVERWVYTGRDLYAAYDTKQAFSDSYEHGTYTYLPPYLRFGFRAVKPGARYFMKMTKIYWKRFSRPACMAVGAVVGGFLSYHYLPSGGSVDPVSQAVASDAPASRPVPDLVLDTLSIKSSSILGDRRRMVLTDGREAFTQADLTARGYALVITGACSALIHKRGDRANVQSIGC